MRLRDLCAAMHAFFRESNVSLLQRAQLMPEHLPEPAMARRRHPLSRLAGLGRLPASDGGARSRMASSSMIGARRKLPWDFVGRTGAACRASG